VLNLKWFAEYCCFSEPGGAKIRNSLNAPGKAGKKPVKPRSQQQNEAIWNIQVKKPILLN